MMLFRLRDQHALQLASIAEMRDKLIKMGVSARPRPAPRWPSGHRWLSG